MPFYRIRPVRAIRGKIILPPGDKSIAHRSIIISAIAKGKTRIYNFPNNQDCLITLRVFKSLGVGISRMGSSGSNICLEVAGRGLYGLRKSCLPLFAGESGTTFRLLLGILAGQRFRATITAGESLAHRPMRRITEPLRTMGAVIKTHSAQRIAHSATEEYPPITIKGGNLHRISYKMPVASAQVKSALLLAGLYARGATKIIEPIKTRDHTERMLGDFGADIKVRDRIISLQGKKELVSPGIINIPGDISSVNFFIVAAILLPHSELVVESVGINPRRMGLVRVLKRMGANIEVRGRRRKHRLQEPVGQIIVRSSGLTGTRVKSSEVPQLIDELPILMLASCFAKGKTIIYGVEELRVKETDRIFSMQTNLRRMGAKIIVTAYKSGCRRLREKMIIQGGGKLKGSRLSSFNDHRTAMSTIIAGLVSKGETLIDDLGCIAKSFPDFLKVSKSVIK
jgi:3-phosphoshikimate 1-carboxyvinyltransferase